MFSNPLNTIPSILCDCTDKGINCFTTSVTKNTLRIAYICPYIDTSIYTTISDFFFLNDSINPEKLCSIFNISQVPYQQFELSSIAKLSSEVFERRLPNTLSVVVNNKNASVGQLLSPGVEILFDPTVLSGNVLTCIKQSSYITNSPLFPVRGIGQLANDNVTIIAITALSDNEGDYCFNVTKPGTYFAIQLDPAWESLDQIPLAYKYISGVLYVLVILGTIYQYIQLCLEKNVFKQSGERKYNHKMLFLTVILVFSIARAIYWFAPPLGIAGNYLTFELPTFLFFSMYSSILYLWSEVVYLTRKIKAGKTEVKTAFNIYILFNLFLVIVFATYVLFFNLWQDPVIPCQLTQSQSGEAKGIINSAYLITIGIITLGMAVLFIVEGLMLFCYIYNLNKRRAKKKNSSIFTTVFVIVFSLCFFTKSVLYLISASVNDFQFPLLLFVIFEIIPSAGLLLHLKPCCALRKAYRQSTLVSQNSMKSDIDTKRRR